ncbi:MAG: NnrU family protein [Sphingopyxis sp.]|nr:NnrU family protein [Sphingopyxis sp.]
MTDIGYLALASAAFVGTHFLLSHPLRAPLARAMGEGAFRGLYSLVALATFGWMLWAWLAVPKGVPAWLVGDTGWILATAAMWFASVLLAGSFIGNPALPMPGAAGMAMRNPVGVLAITRHPMMWSFAVWAVVHMLIWPTPENHVLSTAILILALGGALGQDMKKAALMGDAWRGWARRTAFVPFSGQIGGRIPWGAAWPGSIALIGGTILWLALSWAHTPMGARVEAGIWRWIG